jgi:hypothetical protein
MNSSLVDTNVVLLTRNSDYTDIDQIWLVENGVCNRDDFKKEATVFLPSLIQVVAPTYNLQCMSNRITLTVTSAQGDRFEELRARLTPFLRIARRLNVHAIGMNMKFWLEPQPDLESETSRILLRNTSCPASPFFGQPDAMYGSYFSATFGEFRLKLDIKPITATLPSGPRSYIEMNFNYHKDLAPPPDPAHLETLLSSWPESFDRASNIVNAMLEAAPR